MDFYNEIDPYAADWLENLIAAGHIPGGKVDRRSIRDIKPEELEPYRWAHFFSGVGGWPLALRLAGWPATESVWTGSCPCQSFSAAGEQEGLADDRNLWPAWFDQIRVRRPDTIFGEQVSNAVGFGWLDGVCADLEGAGYTVGACVLGAHSVGAPHIRKRLFWVGESIKSRLERQSRNVNGRGQSGQIDSASTGSASTPSSYGGLADSTSNTSPKQQYGPGTGLGREPEAEHSTERSGSGFWDRYGLIPCSDGKARRIEPGTFPLAHGVPDRVGKLRAYGNAIVPQVAAEFIKAFMEIRNG